MATTASLLPEFANSASSGRRKLFDLDVIAQIGEGAGSIIYAVSDPASRQIYALKHVIRKTDKDARFIEQIESEYEVGRQVSHPGLRKSIDLRYNRTLLRKVTDAGLVMELFDGTPLDTQLPTHMVDLTDVFIQTADALHALHQTGYVHCDLKPNNILLSAVGRVKVIDLGQACKAGTAKKRIQGTPDFIAPEQVKCQPCSFRTDIFNFGATMYWALTGGKRLATLFNLKKTENSFLVDDQMTAPHQLNPDVPEPLSNLVMECVRTKPQKRPSDMAEVSNRLQIVRHAVERIVAKVPA